RLPHRHIEGAFTRVATSRMEHGLRTSMPQAKGQVIMRTPFSRTQSSSVPTQHLGTVVRCALATVILVSVLSACGGSTGKLHQGQGICHIPDPRNGHQGYGQQLYDVGFWQPAEMVVGLASKDGSSPVDADIGQVANEINGILARWATDPSGNPLAGTTSDTSDF